MISPRRVSVRAAVGLGLLVGCRTGDTAPRSNLDSSAPAAAADAHAAAPPRAPMREIRFAWQPSRGPETAYAMPSPEDQHRIVVLPGVEPTANVPVVVALHGQPRRGTPPRSYEFGPIVIAESTALVDGGRVRPFVLVLPVFRFEGTNWPGLELRELRREVEQILRREGVTTGDWYAFGHSGAAGCGGDGLNRPLGLAPRGVGLLDTCLGPGFGRAVRDLQREKVPTVIIHSVETAGFAVRQKTEYLPTFDFGQAYGPLGLAPCACPGDLPHALRDQPYRCAATGDGTIRAFVVDTGDGLAAHTEALRVGARFFLRTMLGRN